VVIINGGNYGLISILQDEKIVINGSCLVEYVDLLNKLSSDAITPVEHKTYIDARIYFVFENNKGRKIFDVAMWGGDDSSIFVNGVEVEGSDIFYQAIMPFLPIDAAGELETFLNRGRRE